MKKKVVILGSKPNAYIPDVDYYYCANSAVGYYKESLKNCQGKIINLVAASEIVKSKRKSNDKEDWLKNKFKMIVDSDSDEIVLIGNEFFPNAESNISNNYLNPFSKLTFNEIERLSKLITGFSWPIITKYHVIPLKLESVKNILKYFIDFCKYKTSKKHLSNGLFRPSTGIISLIYAIQIHGVNATYFICGIGIKQRDKYPDGINNTWSPSKSMASFHVYADKIILKKLKKKYDLRFDDIDFSNF
tara:strand:+ start:2151 stop:2888 length:738 start_codon:yes stop_codon:yes gene_type:complete